MDVGKKNIMQQADDYGKQFLKDEEKVAAIKK